MLAWSDVFEHFPPHETEFHTREMEDSANEMDEWAER